MNQNYFELFALPVGFALDSAALDQAYRRVQGEVHPDKFAHAGEAERRVAMQWATLANEAYQALKSPLKRARYLCEINGVDLQIETNTSMAPAFLMQQMDWRDALDDAKGVANEAALLKLEGELKRARAAEIEAIAKLIDEQKDYAGAARHVRQLMFVDKFGEEVANAVEALDA
ncbi:Fe-S protein assembly co-chaperone HscB [Derxia lacustris]|uniref:Fe-S protein assembly co-chaperone HscB n=1 Tax=Derxia lacustris TaxID=764842 RepID=UPI000A175619|nr:Fe-S protein assembly co-chaperone HscB [Derxia lacustris]